MQQNNTLLEIKQKARLDKFRGVFFSGSEFAKTRRIKICAMHMGYV